jgi:pimeloyl-ACP methyl ester carboxylesterase
MWRLVRLVGAVSASLTFAVAAEAGVVKTTPVTFTVNIQNTSLVPCLGAGSGPATIAGTLVAPKPLPPNVTLYLHGLGFGRWFWHFDPGSDLDFATKLAEQGHASVFIDRLGYGDSDRPDGNQSCIGVQADIAHQIIGQLRTRFSFSKVALAGHSAGGAVAEVAAYSFPDVDAAIVVSYADQGASADTLLAFLQGGGECLSSSDHYGHFGQTDADFAHLMFNTPRPTTGKLPLLDSDPTADPSVIAAVTAMREPDPCGDYNSIPAEIAFSQLLLSQIRTPVLQVCGDKDAVFPPPACDLQALHFLANPQFTHLTIAGAGHAITLGTTAAAFRDGVSCWLSDHGF